MMSALLFWYFFSAWPSSAWHSSPLGRSGGVSLLHMALLPFGEIGRGLRSGGFLGLPQYETVLNSSQVLKLSGKEKEKVLSAVKKAPVSVVW